MVLPSPPIVFEDGLLDALERPMTPPPQLDDDFNIDPLLRRKHPRSEDDSSPEEDDDGVDKESGVIVFNTTEASPKTNLLNYTRCLCRAKRFKPDQQHEMERFAQADPSVKLINLYASLLEVTAAMNKQISAAPAFKLSDAAIMNIKEFSAAVLLSPSVGVYRGGGPVGHVLRVLRTYTTDIPTNIDTIPAHLNEVNIAIQHELTQHRSAWKKLVAKSVVGNTKVERLDIHELTKSLALKGRVTVTIPLCARVAMMRYVYLKDKGPTFWGTLDSQIAKMRVATSGHGGRLVRAYRHILDEDIKLHGALSPSIIQGLPDIEIADDRQEQVANTMVVVTALTGPVSSPTAASSSVVTPSMSA